MASSSTGKWVNRVGSSGGGKAYKKARPANYYGILGLIVLLGVLSIIFARYQYQNPASTPTTPPAVGTTWYSALATEECGIVLPNVAASTSTTNGIVMASNNVIKVAPQNSSESGNNATVQRLIDNTSGLTFSKDRFSLPGSNGLADPKYTFNSGDTCDKTSKYPGQKGQPVIAYWTSLVQKAPKITTDPSTIHFSNYLRVTLAFEPKGVTPKAPSAVTVAAMFKAGSGVTTTTTATSTTTTTTPKG